MSKLLVLLATLVASMTAPALAAETDCYHFRCNTAPLQVQVLPRVPLPRVPHR
jgi:hypothetical protein